MEKDLRAINKVYRKITDDDVKKKLEALIEDLETDDEGTEEPAEKVEEKKAEPESETPQEEPKEVQTQEKQAFDIDEIKAQLGLEKVEALVVAYDEKINKLEEEIKKSRNSGYSPGQAQQEPDTTVDDIFARLKTNHLKK